MAKKIRNWISKRRTELGLSQDDIAAELKKVGFALTRSTISGWENNRYFPPLHEPTFRKSLALVLELPVSEMLRLAGYEIPERSEILASSPAAGLRKGKRMGYRDSREVAMDVISILTDHKTVVVTDYETLQKIRNLVVHDDLPPTMRVKMNIVIEIETVQDDENESEQPQFVRDPETLE